MRCSSLFPFSGWALGLHKIGECPKDVGASPIGWVWYVAEVGVGWEAYQDQALAIAGLSLGGRTEGTSKGRVGKGWMA